MIEEMIEENERINFIDRNGKFWESDELNELNTVEIENLGFHVAET